MNLSIEMAPTVKAEIARLQKEDSSKQRESGATEMDD